MGNMNIDLLKYQSHTNTCNYPDKLFSHGYLPSITKPTRVTPSTATLIDHCYTNDIVNHDSSGIIINDVHVADHFGTFYISSSNIEHKTSAQNEYRSYIFKKKIEILKKLLENQTDFSNILQIPCANEAYIQFMIQYIYAFEKAFPLKKSKIKKQNVKREPWFTSGFFQNQNQTIDQKSTNAN